MYQLTIKNRVEGSKDSRNRVAVTYTAATTPLLALAIGPTSSDAIDTQREEKYSETLTLYLPKASTILTTDRVVWQGQDYEVLKVSDYSYGPWSIGGVTAIIGLPSGVKSNG